MIENKKVSILLILKVLEEYSDEDHFLTQQDIIEKVNQLYGIELERKSVAFSISLLQELDYDINKSPRGGYALLSRDFDCTEIQFITDAIFSSKSISGKQALKLTNKLNSSLSKYQRKSYDYIYKSGDINRSLSNEVFYTLELIEEAKRRGKRISFQYLSFDENGNKVVKHDGFRYIVSPYYSVNSNFNPNGIAASDHYPVHVISGINASLYNPIYSDEVDTVQPPAIGLIPQIKYI